ncbi:MAG: hypothetical protein K0R71_1694 [Bacillales bacterium]|jgi:hypothetical protein|nr:hypothetical protein [Bacillales bacterium]
MSNGFLIGIKCFLGVILTAIIYAVFFMFYKSTLVHIILNPYVGLVTLVVVLIAALVAGLVLAFKLTSKWG